MTHRVTYHFLPFYVAQILNKDRMFSSNQKSNSGIMLVINNCYQPGLNQRKRIFLTVNQRVVGSSTVLVCGKSMI